MARHRNKCKFNTRASPSSDGNGNAIYIDDNTRAYPRSDAKDMNTRSQTSNTRIRLATWNLGTMTGRSNELSNILRARQINICCIQETKWKGAKSRDIGNDYQIVYYGTSTTRNVGIIIDNTFKQRIIKIDRKSDRIIAIKFALDSQPALNIISAYAPQTGCRNQEKLDFWEDLDEIMQDIPNEEYTHLAGDLNGHVGEKVSTHENVHATDMGW